MSKKRNKKRKKKKGILTWNFKYAIDLIRKNDKVFSLKYEKDLTFLEKLTRQLTKDIFFFQLEQRKFSKQFYQIFMSLKTLTDKYEYLIDTIQNFKKLSEDEAFKALDSGFSEMMETLKNKQSTKPVDKMTDEEIENEVNKIFNPIKDSITTYEKIKKEQGEEIEQLSEEELKEWTDDLNEAIDEISGAKDEASQVSSNSPLVEALNEIVDDLENNDEDKE